MTDTTLFWVLFAAWFISFWSVLFVNRQLTKRVMVQVDEIARLEALPPAYGHVMVTLREVASTAYTFAEVPRSLDIEDQTFRFSVRHEVAEMFVMDVDEIEWCWFPNAQSRGCVGPMTVRHSQAIRLNAGDTMTFELNLHVDLDGSATGPVQRPPAKRV